jgi:hypothetical protein
MLLETALAKQRFDLEVEYQKKVSLTKI